MPTTHPNRGAPLGADPSPAGPSPAQRPASGQSACAVEAALAVVGGKWKALILYHLSTAAVRRFNELRRLIPGATQQMLTLQLRELERDGLVRREVYPQVPPKVEYSLTAPAAALVPILEQIGAWGARYVAGPAVDPGSGS